MDKMTKEDKEPKEYDSIGHFLQENNNPESMSYIIEMLLERVVDMQEFMLENGLSEEDYFEWKEKNDSLNQFKNYLM
jgi:hypothetical protein